MPRSNGREVDSHYAIKPECQAEAPKTRFKPRARKTLSPRRWQVAFTEDGHLDIAGVLRRIQRGGIHPSIRGEVWEFLLGCFDPNSTSNERKELRQRRRDQYAAWKSECQKMVPVIGSGKIIMVPIVTEDGQPIKDPSINSGLGTNGGVIPSSAALDKKMTRWKLSLTQIGLDVVRTDGALVFYESEANQAKLWDVLAIYAWTDTDISYVQGMNDICSAMIILLENEADAFWCFQRAMQKLRENFRSDSNSMGVQSQLRALSGIVKVIDPKLHRHLEALNAGEYLFAFRMLMVLFRREFSFADSLYLWEVMWAMEYNPQLFAKYEGSNAVDIDTADKKLMKQYGKFERNNLKTGKTDQKNSLAVYLAASYLENKNKQLLRNAKGLDDIVTILANATSNSDARKSLNKALNIQQKYLKKTKAA